MLPSRVCNPRVTVRASALLHVGFVVTGIVTTLLGPILPSLSSRWALSDAQAGYLFTAQFMGSILGVAISGRVISRFGFRPALSGAYSLMAAGVALLAILRWPFTSMAVLTLGAGLGLAIPATNLCVSDANPQRRAAALNILNLAWGIGAVLSAPLVSVSNRLSSIRLFLLSLGIALGIFVVALLWLGSSIPRHNEEHGTSTEPLLGSGASSLVVLGAIFYLYVGTESSVGGWIASFAERVGDSSSSVWLLAPSFFWGALLAGRAASALILRRLAEIRVAIMGLLVATAGIVVLIASHNNAAVFFSAVLAGCGLAPIYPIAIALLSHRFGAASSRVAPILFTLASLGGATLPWTIGAVSTHFGHLRAGLFVPLVTTAMMVVLYAASAKLALPASAPATSVGAAQ